MLMRRGVRYSCSLLARVETSVSTIDISVAVLQIAGEGGEIAQWLGPFFCS